MEIVRTIADLRARIADWRREGDTVGLVPTMGALHEGHRSLVRLAAARADRTVATLFVNPKQFGPGEDFDRYPRDEAADAAMFETDGAVLVFAPGVDEVYSPGYATRVHVEGLGDVLEGEFRPGFFTGVATVVTKLLVQALPDVAVFGEKDYQQLQVIKRLTRDLDLPVEIVGGPTVREPDGLAMSSRNAYLSTEERAQAPALYRAIMAVAETAAAGGDATAALARARDDILAAGFREVDYVTLRDAETLVEVDRPMRPVRVLAAAWLGRARLIDNVAVGPVADSY